MPVVIDIVISINPDTRVASVSDGLVAAVSAIVHTRLPIDLESLLRNLRRFDLGGCLHV